MISRLKIWEFALVDLFTKLSIDIAGGLAFVCASGAPTLLTLLNADTGLALANPLTPVRGKYRFATAETVEKVDLFVLSPTGHFMTFIGLAAPQGWSELMVDTQRRSNVAVIPFSVAHSGYAATVEYDTGFDFPLNSLLLPHPVVKVTTVDATETIDVGLLSTETSGDADGLIAAASVATAGNVLGAIANGANTMGALFEGQDSASAGDLVPKGHVVQGANAKSLTWTLSAGSDTAAGYIVVPYILLGLSELMP